MNSLDVIQTIARLSPSIKCLSFHEFPKQQLVQESDIIWGEREQHMFDMALEFKKEGLPFWDGIMLSAFNNTNFSEALLQLALHHNAHEKVTYVRVEDLLVWLDKEANNIDGFAFCSKVIMSNGEELHLPLIDFHVPVSESNEKVVEYVCRLLKLSNGWILDSGESYHFIGANPMCYSDLEKVIHKALMFTPIVDKAWISHQLREKSCSLRIGKKRGLSPVVVKQIR